MTISQGTVSISGTGNCDGSGNFTIDSGGDSIALFESGATMIVNGNSYSPMKISSNSVSGVWELAGDYSWSATVRKILGAKGSNVYLPWGPDTGCGSLTAISFYVPNAANIFSLGETPQIEISSYENVGRNNYTFSSGGGTPVLYGLSTYPAGVANLCSGFIVTAVDLNGITVSVPTYGQGWQTLYDGASLVCRLTSMGGEYVTTHAPSSGTMQMNYIISSPSSTNIFYSNADGGAGPTFMIPTANYENSEQPIRGLNRGIF